MFFSLSSSFPPDFFFFFFFCNDSFHVKKYFMALAGVAQWIELWPANKKVAGWIPSQGTCLGCGPGPQKGVCERQPHIDVSLPLFLLPFPSV